MKKSTRSPRPAKLQPELRSKFLFETDTKIELPLVFGDTPLGRRQYFQIVSGTFAGPGLRGEILPCGGDWVLIRPDGVHQMDVRAALRTHDGELIYLYYRGIFRIDPKLYARMLNREIISPSKYYFRITPVFETASKKYGWLNSIVCVGVGRISAKEFTYQFFEIL